MLFQLEEVAIRSFASSVRTPKKGPGEGERLVFRSFWWSLVSRFQIEEKTE